VTHCFDWISLGLAIVPLCHGTGTPGPFDEHRRSFEKNENNAPLQKDMIHLEWHP